MHETLHVTIGLETFNMAISNDEHIVEVADKALKGIQLLMLMLHICNVACNIVRKSF